jgi:hypothetical protein
MQISIDIMLSFFSFQFFSFDKDLFYRISDFDKSLSRKKQSNFDFFEGS